MSNLSVNVLIVFLRGLLVLSLIAINMFLFAVVIFPFAVTAKILPGKGHLVMMRLALKLPVLWMHINRWILNISTQGKWTFQGKGQLCPNQNYLMISNHQSWMDILVLGLVFNGKIPLLKFFMKKELLWQLPIAGVDCYLLGYPILKRYRREEIRKKPSLKSKDAQAISKACEKLGLFPAVLINFVEGTRFTEEKRVRQRADYQHLLKPKSAGVAVVINQMASKLRRIINVTIDYQFSGLSYKSLWHFFCGNVERITVCYEVIPVSKELLGDYYGDREYRKIFQQWLNQLWKEKDQLIESLKRSNEKSTSYRNS